VSLRTAARAYEIRAETERDPVKRGRWLMMRNTMRRRAEYLAREIEEMTNAEQ
jgi:hypothetical protein